MSEGVRKAGVLVTARGEIDFYEGDNITLVIEEGSVLSNTVKVTISSAGGGPPSGAAGGDLSGTYPNPSVQDDSHAHTSATAPGTTHPDLATHDALGLATDAELATHVGAADPHTGYRLESADHTHQSSGIQAGTIDHGLAITGLTDDDHTQYLKEKAAGGVAAEVPTHTHADAANAGTIDTAGPDANITIDGTGAAGTAGTIARSAHGHQVTTTDAPSGANITIDAAASAASTGSIARAGHGHRMNTSSTAAAAIGTAAAGTSGHSPSRDDHVHPTGAGTPSTQAFGDAAAVGSGPAAAMTDHKHAMPTGTAGPDANITVDSAGAAGTANTAARSAHGHQLATYSSAAAAIGTAAAGTSGSAPSRGDHVHSAAYSAITGNPIEYNIYALDPGSPSILTGGLMTQPARIQLSSTERLTEAGTGRMRVSDAIYDDSALRFRAPGSGAVMTDEYVFWINRVEFRGDARQTVVNNGRIILNDVRPNGRLVLAGTGGGN